MNVKSFTIKSKIRIFKVHDKFKYISETRPFAFKISRRDIDTLIKDIKEDVFMYKHTIVFY
mgnify:CR=1 FL=1